MHGIPSRRTILPNLDGIGWSRKMTDDENMHRLTYAFITMGSLEVDGRLEEVAQDRIALLNKVIAHMDRGHVVHCPDEDAFTGRPLPECLTVDYPEESITARRGISRHIAFFNWSDEVQCTGYDLHSPDSASDDKIHDFWTGEEVRVNDGRISAWLQPHSARLFEVRS
jgi:hypothetical protein